MAEEGGKKVLTEEEYFKKYKREAVF